MKNLIVFVLALLLFPLVGLCDDTIGMAQSIANAQAAKAANEAEVFFTVVVGLLGFAIGVLLAWLLLPRAKPPGGWQAIVDVSLAQAKEILVLRSALRQIAMGGVGPGLDPYELAKIAQKTLDALDECVITQETP